MAAEHAADQADRPGAGRDHPCARTRRDERRRLGLCAPALHGWGSPAAVIEHFGHRRHALGARAIIYDAAFNGMNTSQLIC